MNTKIAYCGLICDTCPVLLATLEQDKGKQQSLRISIAEQCSKLYSMDMHPEDVTDCDGCRTSNGRLFSGCVNCEIRKCASQKNIENCAYCEDYACDKLEKHFAQDPDAKVRLEEIRKAL